MSFTLITWSLREWRQAVTRISWLASSRSCLGPWRKAWSGLGLLRKKHCAQPSELAHKRVRCVWIPPLVPEVRTPSLQGAGRHQPLAPVMAVFLVIAVSLVRAVRPRAGQRLAVSLKGLGYEFLW